MTVQKEPHSNGECTFPWLSWHAWIAWEWCPMHPLPTNRSDFVQMFSCQVLSLPRAPRGISLLVHIDHIDYILLATACFRNKQTCDGILANEIDMKCVWVLLGMFSLFLKRDTQKRMCSLGLWTLFCEDMMLWAAAATSPPWEFKAEDVGWHAEDGSSVTRLSQWYEISVFI